MYVHHTGGFLLPALSVGRIFKDRQGCTGLSGMTFTHRVCLSDDIDSSSSSDD